MVITDNHTMQGDTNQAVILREWAGRKRTKSELIVPTFCFTVECFEGKRHPWKTVQHYWKNHCVYLVPLKQYCLDHGSRQNVSQKHISPQDSTFSFWQNRSLAYLAQRIFITNNVIIDEIRSLCYLSSKDGCDWTIYLQNPTPVPFQGSLSI